VLRQTTQRGRIQVHLIVRVMRARAAARSCLYLTSLFPTTRCMDCYTLLEDDKAKKKYVYCSVPGTHVLFLSLSPRWSVSLACA
jgi:hypothetical protein